ncbi:MAG: flagellar motor protein MotB [Acetobacteraceae bacterium]|jgi:chemotaxis protein MotB
MSGRSRRGGHEEAGHGGQWKVAYADFVTAMMAFFLIMWLVSSATETQRAVIAKYFSTTSLIDLPAGNGVLNGGKSMIDQATQKSERLTPKGRSGDPHARDNTQTAPAPDTHAVQDRLERQRFEALKAELERMMRQGELRDLANNLSIEMTPEGLRIQIFDRDGESMFAPGSADPTSRLSRILMVISQVLQTVQNKVILAGHTDGQVMQRGLYTNWELSADRANAVRRQLEADGLSPNRTVRVEGRAAMDLLLPQTPADPRNRRIAVTVLRGEAETSSQDKSPT